MKRQIILRFGILCIAVAIRGNLLGEMKPLPTIKISNPKDLVHVQALNKDLTALGQKVTECVKAGGKPEICQCSDPALLESLRKGYHALLKLHPDWKDQLLSYEYVSPEGRNMSGTLILSNLRRQLEMLKCE